jgi:hypothetical protein
VKFPNPAKFFSLKMFYRQYREEKIVFPRHKVGKEYCFAHLSRTLDRNQKAYEKRTRSIEVQAIWANPIPQKEQSSVLEEGVGMTVGASARICSCGWSATFTNSPLLGAERRLSWIAGQSSDCGQLRMLSQKHWPTVSVVP